MDSIYLVKVFCKCSIIEANESLRNCQSFAVIVVKEKKDTCMYKALW